MRPVVVRAPRRDRPALQYHEVRLRTNRSKVLEGHADRAIAGAVDPAAVKVERHETPSHVIGRISEIGGGLFGLPVIDPGTFAAVLQVVNVMAQQRQAHEVLEVVPGVATDGEATGRAGDDDDHAGAAGASSEISSSRARSRLRRCSSGCRCLASSCSTHGAGTTLQPPRCRINIRRRCQWVFTCRSLRFPRAPPRSRCRHFSGAAARSHPVRSRNVASPSPVHRRAAGTDTGRHLAPSLRASPQVSLLLKHHVHHRRRCVTFGSSGTTSVIHFSLVVPATKLDSIHSKCDHMIAAYDALA